MGDKLAASAVTYTQRECKGFHNDTARSFLRRHADPGTLLVQLKELFLKGERSSCKDLIQIICEEMHPLSESSQLFLLKAEIAFEEDNEGVMISALKQAEIIDRESLELSEFRKLIAARDLLKDGCYSEGVDQLRALISGENFNAQASFLLGQHLLFKTPNTDEAVFNLQTALEARPYVARAWAALGFAFNRIGKKEKAQQAFVRAIELESNPDKIEFYKTHLAS